MGNQDGRVAWDEHGLFGLCAQLGQVQSVTVGGDDLVASQVHPAEMASDGVCTGSGQYECQCIFEFLRRHPQHWLELVGLTGAWRTRKIGRVEPEQYGLRVPDDDFVAVVTQVLDGDGVVGGPALGFDQLCQNFGGQAGVDCALGGDAD